jgi:3-methyladenine DNA glycosylase AlkC
LAGMKRVGARRPELVPLAVLAELEVGGESANHMEQIAMDMGNLLEWQFPRLAWRAGELRDIGLVARMRRGGQILNNELGLDGIADACTWRSDTARGWAAMAIGHADGLSLRDRLSRIRVFADDPHFAVREWAWLSLRPHVAGDTDHAISVLSRCTAETSERLRRFASEITRPRGVWSAHLVDLKRDPERGIGVLEPLKSDPSRYVQDSVANWLNDASKTTPSWVREVCARWRAESSSPATERICRRAQRSLDPQALDASRAG